MKPEPAFPSAPVDPMEAWRAFNRLIADKEDTRHVFDFIRAVNGRSGEPHFRRFLQSEHGRAVIADRSKLERALTGRAALEAMGPGTFAAAYLEYLDQEGLDPLGVREAAIASAPDIYETLRRDYPEFEAMTFNGQLTHDLFHVLTGYGRDALGEALLLVFTGVQNGSRGVRLLGRMAGLRIRWEVRALPVGRMMTNAVRMAETAENFATTDLTALFPLPLEAARARLKVAPDPLYAEIRAGHEGPELFAVEPGAKAA